MRCSGSFVLYIYFMNRLADEKNERRKVQKRDTALSYIKVVLYVLGFLSCLYTLKQYNFTLIDFKTTFLIGFAPALLATFVLERNYKYYLFCVVVFSYFFLVHFSLSIIYLVVMLWR